MESSLRGVPSAYHPPDLMDIVFAFTGRIFETNNIVGAGFSSFFLSTLIYMISGVFSRIFSKTYNQLSIKDQHRWNAGINRGICGLILATRGLLSLLRGIPEGGLVALHYFVFVLYGLLEIGFIGVGNQFVSEPNCSICSGFLFV
eukprot:m.22537 g.22537  ORF g.22537 m.22537 type:complete len:145 (+) comp7409_c0_seq3:115-549(+)